MTPKTIAESIVGAVDWQSENHGLCKCPGEAAHTSHTRVRDTTVFIDGAPTIFCWHSSCAPYRDEANRKLRRAISSDPLYKPANIMSGGTSAPRLVIQKDPESEVLDRIKTMAESNKQRYLTHYNWDPADMFEESPIPIPDAPKAQYEAMLSLFRPDDIVWIGGVKDSGNHPLHFKTATQWLQTPPISQFTTAGVFAAGTISRANENVISRRYLVIESDVLTKPQMGAVFQLMRDLFQMKLYAVVDTAGKSLHGWLEMPKQEWFNQLKAFLIPLGCDPATFKPSQPVRMPGVKRNDKTQSLLWFCQGGK